MNYNLFGFLFKDKHKDQLPPISFAPPPNEDAAMIFEGSGVNQQVLDLDGSIHTEIELISKYREIARRPEVEGAVSEIVNEAIVTEKQKSPVALVTDKLNFSDDIVTKIQEEFDNILNLLDFNNNGQEIFRKWYIDGRLCYHIIIDPNKPRDGIQELRPVDPRRIKAIIEVENMMTQEGVPVQVEKQRYYKYNPFGNDNSAVGGVNVAWDSICYVHSNNPDQENRMMIGFLDKAIKPSNMLTMVEDATVIYRLSRAPERRVFYIDTGSLPNHKAEQYLKKIQLQYRNKMVYDAATGEVRDDKKFLSFMEDYWLPRRDGGRGTEISTLPGGENLGEMADVEYFREKLYQSLNVPVSRLQSQATMSFGEGASITREEVKFGKFIQRLRTLFSHLFDNLLSTQLMLKGVITKDDWNAIRQKVFYDYLNDTYYSEMKNLELVRERIGCCESLLNFAGKYVSHEWVRRTILQQTDQDIAQLDAQMAKEKSDPRYQAIEAMSGMGGMGMGMDPSMGGDPSMMSGDPNDPNSMNGDSGFSDEDESGMPQQQPQSQDDEDEDDSPALNLDSLPTERITKNVEALWTK